MIHKEKLEKNLVVNYIIKNYRMWLVLCYIVPASMVKSAVATWSKLYLSDQGYFLPITNKWMSSLLWYGCLFLGILAACWCSDKLFSGVRWMASIFFQFILIVLLLFLWLVPGNIVVTYYFYLVFAVFSLSGGLFISIFIEAIELTHKKILAQSIGVIVLFMYVTNVVASNFLSGIVIEQFGWNWYFVVLIVFSMLCSLGLAKINGKDVNPNIS